MKKTHKDRIDLIDRLERKYTRKIQLRNQHRERNFKNTLRAIRGQHLSGDEILDPIFYRDPKIAF